MLLTALAITTALTLGDPPSPPNYEPEVSRPLAGEILVFDADFVVVTPYYLDVLDGVQAGFGTVAYADDTGMIRLRVDPERDYEVRATIVIMGPDGDDYPDTEPDPYYFPFEHSLPVTRDHRIESAVRMMLEGIRRFTDEGGNFFDLSYWMDYINNEPQE